MTLATAGVPVKPYGGGGRKINLPVAATTQIYEGTLVAWKGSALVPASTTGAGDAVGVAEHDALGGASDGLVRVMVWTDKEFCFPNGSNAFSDATPVGTVAFCEDDHTVGTGGIGGTGEGVAGLFMGMNDDGQVRVYVFPNVANNQYVPVNGTALTDANQTVNVVGRQSRFLMATMTAGRSVTLGTTGAKVGDIIRIVRTDTSANTLAVVNGGAGAGTLATLVVSKIGFVQAYFDGTNWKYDGSSAT